MQKWASLSLPSALLETDVADIDRDQELIGNRVAVGIGAIRPASSGNLDALGLDRAVNVMDGGKPSRHVDPVIIATQEVVVSEVELLDGRVRCDSGWKVRLQAPPRLPVVLDGIDLPYRHTVQRQIETAW